MKGSLTVFALQFACYSDAFCVHNIWKTRTFILCKARKIEIRKREQIIYLFISILYHWSSFYDDDDDALYLLYVVLGLVLRLLGNTKYAA